MPDETSSKKLAELLKSATETAQFWRSIKQPTEMTHMLCGVWSITTALVVIARELALAREQRGSHA